MPHSEPKLFVISRPNIDVDEVIRFISSKNLSWHRTNGAQYSEELVEICGRICYMSFHDDVSKTRYPVSKYIENLIEQGHDSVLEHANWTFIIDNVSRAFTHQLVRHRIGFSFSQLSQQYHDESHAEFVTPETISENAEIESVWREAVEHSANAYRAIISKLAVNDGSSRKESLRAVRSAARSLLPNATATTIAVTANARALRHFFSVRGAIMGDLEMRRVSDLLLTAVKADAPSLFGDFSSHIADDGCPLVVRKR